MSTCPQCYTGTCKRHKSQDHGRSLVECKSAESTFQKMYDQLVGSKLQKLQAQAEKDQSRQHTKEFRKKLDALRDKSLRKSNKMRSKRNSVNVTGSGLNPQALAAIYGEESDGDRNKDTKKKKQRRKDVSTSDRKRRRADRDDSDSSEDNSDDTSDESHHKHKKSSSSRKHSHRHKKSHKIKKHKRS
ncbi:unnamed protein product [Peronospora farinosa]|uniref:Uncharacterized protein n=1 Tax=Peronospora farinosa TaxID=134698 RepID=A0AAV0TVG1_9STRA|nr:unnamed protein product [Peronospora farinosa]CAI5728251.1 unnamed protein product [Peronospora farinosa]